MMNIWTVDIETSPLIVMVWQLGQQYVSKEQVLEDWHILAFSAKKLDCPNFKQIYMETRNKNDKPLLRKLWKIFNEADVIITQNGAKFDEPKIKARMMLNDFSPYKPFKHYDTFVQNTDKELTSHSLDYMTDKFNTKYKKLKHKNFPGLSLWKECRKNNPEAWKEMKKYNIHDVLSTEELYINTRGWSKSTAPIMYNELGVCSVCGSKSLKPRGYEGTKLSTWQRLRCESCGKWQRGERIKLKGDVK